ncbi:uncharacterized protein LOC123311582 isoform X1 [Coccinella septempunctata]|uniref:uncharacterized protein LOC123311582 isoform X1 n=1 Tax=Coccinella septempunctata TaxID=41139 RepID=UPI001D0778FE|nr:uncharacterized protein LOC123311582 isoform X1 [Coccinella septempunctata]
MAKGILGDTPQEFTEDRFEETTRVENTPSIKLRVIASYVILTLLSAYVIYDYRIRPDCICRPRPYVFAISAFGITGLYGLLGVLNRIFPELKWMYEILDGMEVLLFSVFLPYIAAELWTMNKFFKCYKFIPNILASAGLPSVDYYYFFHKPLYVYMEAAMVIETLTLYSFMAYMTNMKYYVATALTMYGAYFTKMRFNKMPVPECWMTKTETINYTLSACILCASISMI